MSSTVATGQAGEERTLREFLDAAPALSTDERRQIVDQALVLIEQLYVHLPLKRAMHAVDPVQQLRLLRHRLEPLTDRAFHDEMLRIFIGLRDLHTNYILPAPFRGAIAVLPFRLEEYREGEGRRHYIVSAVAPGLTDPHFGLGVEVTHWNGIPIERAVDLNGERNAGSNLDARHARGLASMTQRPMALLAAPDEDWVTLSFLAGGEAHEVRFDWQVLEPPPSPTGVDASDADSPAARALGIDALTEAVRRAQKTVLAPSAIDLEREMAADDSGVAPAPDLTKVSVLPDVLEFRSVPTGRGEVGYLRIRTFNVQDVDGFVDEVVRIVGLLPQRGLIVDVRGNGGGVITAGERLLQLFTPATIQPERLHFINTPLTARLTTLDGLQEWQPSIEEAVEIGTTFSDGFPIFAGHVEDCNRTGQRYWGAVALVIDPLCYSTTDIFSAGWQDHDLGPVVGTGGHTGAGGANVWTHELLVQALPGIVNPMPRQTSMRVAIRRTSRVGERAGDPLEDLGVAPDHVHAMTRRDLLERNADLIDEVAGLLAALPPRTLAAEASRAQEGVKVSLHTAGLSRVDAYVDGRPRTSIDVQDGDHDLPLALAGGEHEVDLRGFEDGALVTRRRLELPG
jgi:Peptidase family S41